MNSESSGNSQTTLEKGGKNPPDVSLDNIVKDLLLYVNGFECLHEAKKVIEEKYDINIDHSNCWPADDIRRAWGKTQRMDIKSSRRRHWAIVILLQVIKMKLYEDECNRNSAQPDPTEGNLSQSCEESSPQACGTEQSRTEDSEDPSTAEPEMMRPSGPCTSTSNPATRPVYIRIPFSEMFGETPYTNVDPNDRSLFKLIDRPPSHNEIRKRKSYIMSFNDETKNADWVYEILNKETLKDKCKEHMSFGRKEFETKEFNQGHLAAVANHRWCQEAYHDTYLMSNMVPQDKRLNKGIWSTLEQHCRDTAMDVNVHNVHVYTGPLYCGKERNAKRRKKSNNIENDCYLGGKAVPTYFFKVVIVENKDWTVREPEFYLMPNETPKFEGQLEENEVLKEEATIGNKELLKHFKVKIGDFEKQPWLNIIERDTKFNKQMKRKVKWAGEDGNGELHCVGFEVRISPPHV
ncbi:hypothetical protein ABG768_020329 [Culter alburnus]|uniref:Endonuclease G, mitochondrial n=1 Tax=Culter alburnus TaxID=194366 RepID=A0AAW2B0Z7_CULAL